MFHFNKGHLTDPTIPMWVVKAHGVTFYVNHVTSDMPWSTKETPGNETTKGSIKFKKCKLTIDAENNATISTLGLTDVFLKHPKVVHARVMAHRDSEFHNALKAKEFKHSKIKHIHGRCSSPFIICDLLDKDEVLIAALKYATKFRMLVPNEHYYQEYDAQPTHISVDYSDEDTPYEYS